MNQTQLSETMEFAVSRRFDVRSHLIVPNVSWGALNHEADVLVVRQSGHCLEYEIKRTFADYKKDFEKAKWRWGMGGMKNIKEFWYVFPAELFHKRENDILTLLPEGVGVLVVYNGEGLPYSKVKREAEARKGAEPMTDKQMYNVARLGTMRIWNLKRRLIRNG